MDVKIVIIFSFTLLYLLQCLFMFYSCEHTFHSIPLNQSALSWLGARACFDVHSSYGALFIVQKMPMVISIMFDQPLTMIFVIFSLIFAYGTLNRGSEVGQTTRDVAQGLREDIAKAATEIWSAITLVVVTLHRNVTIVKIIEIFIIGILLSSLPDALRFILKTWATLAET